MSELCNCDVAEDTHEHCIECENVLKCNESENLCRWCEERIADEANNKEFAFDNYSNASSSGQQAVGDGNVL